jgi:hypothetical protein
MDGGDSCPLSVATVTINGVAFTGEAQLVRKATGYVKKPTPHRPAAGSRLRERSFPAPFDRISDPQIPTDGRTRSTPSWLDAGVGMMHLVCYLGQGSNVFETYWTTIRGVEAIITATGCST